MPQDANETLEQSRSDREKYFNALSDRTRTLCLGALALIWGILIQKSPEHGIHTTHVTKVFLFVIGFLAIFVLVLDFGEYAFAFLYRRQLAKGESSRSYDHWEDYVRISKISVGGLTLLSLVAVLACLLLGSLKAQGQEFSQLGKWCGDHETKFTCVYLLRPLGNLSVQVSVVGYEGLIPCETVSESTNTIEATCEKTSTETGSGIKVTLYLEVTDRNTILANLQGVARGNPWDISRALYRYP